MHDKQNYKNLEDKTSLKNSKSSDGSEKWSAWRMGKLKKETGTKLLRLVNAKQYPNCPLNKNYEGFQTSYVVRSIFKNDYSDNSLGKGKKKG